jgi:hypothetical protein
MVKIEPLISVNSRGSDDCMSFQEWKPPNFSEDHRFAAILLKRTVKMLRYGLRRVNYQDDSKGSPGVIPVPILLDSFIDSNPSGWEDIPKGFHHNDLLNGNTLLIWKHGEKIMANLSKPGDDGVQFRTGLWCVCDGLSDTYSFCMMSGRLCTVTLSGDVKILDYVNS